MKNKSPLPHSDHSESYSTEGTTLNIIFSSFFFFKSLFQGVEVGGRGTWQGAESYYVAQASFKLKSIGVTGMPTTLSH
jgi:hypothetical protein